MLKVSAGKYKRFKIKTPNKKGIRPSQSKLRLHIFNYLADFVENAVVLDLFAGSGAFGIEALSRGAKQVVFVDKVSSAIFTIKKNIEKLGLQDRVQIIKKDALKFLVRAKKSHMRFDIIFIDPPFDKLLKMSEEERTEYLKQLLTRAYDVLNPKSIIVLKMHKKIEIPIPGEMLEFHTYTMGINKVYYLLQKQYVN